MLRQQSTLTVGHFVLYFLFPRGYFSAQPYLTAKIVIFPVIFVLVKSSHDFGEFKPCEQIRIPSCSVLLDFPGEQIVLGRTICKVSSSVSKE